MYAILAFWVTSFIKYLIKQIGAKLFPAVVNRGFWIIANSWGEQNWGYPAELEIQQDRYCPGWHNRNWAAALYQKSLLRVELAVINYHFILCVLH